MNKIIIGIALAVFSVLVHFGFDNKTKSVLVEESLQRLEEDKSILREKIRQKSLLKPMSPLSISQAYNQFIKQLRLINESRSEKLDLSLSGKADNTDITSYFQESVYQGVKALHIQLTMGTLSQDTDLDLVLDDISLLQKNSDLLITQIIKDPQGLIVKGEIYGI